MGDGSALGDKRARQEEQGRGVRKATGGDAPTTNSIVQFVDER